MKDDQLHSLAYYFLRHLRTEFAGFAGPVDPFLRSILGLSEEQHRSTLSCWDVGAAPVPRNTKGERHKVVEHPEQDVWQICHHHGLATRAFEPSEMGFQRLIASSTSLQDHGSLAIHRLAVSNITGQAHFNRGGQVTGSLGSRGCGHWLSSDECKDPNTWEVVNVTTVDALLGADGILDILKVDVEGHEWQILQGAHRALSSGRLRCNSCPRSILLRPTKRFQKCQHCVRSCSSWRHSDMKVILSDQRPHCQSPGLSGTMSMRSAWLLIGSATMALAKCAGLMWHLCIRGTC